MGISEKIGGEVGRVKRGREKEKVYLNNVELCKQERASEEILSTLTRRELNG